MPPIRWAHFVAEQADEQNGRYENQNVHKYSPIYYCIRSNCQAIKSSARWLRSPTCVGERRLPEECTLLLFCLLDSVIAS